MQFDDIVVTGFLPEIVRNVNFYDISNTALIDSQNTEGFLKGSIIAQITANVRQAVFLWKELKSRYREILPSEALNETKEIFLLTV